MDCTDDILHINELYKEFLNRYIELNKLVNSTYQLYKKNKNMFEKFYRNNRDLYKEASEKVLKYTKK